MFIETKKYNTEVYIPLHVLPCLPTPCFLQWVDDGLEGLLSDNLPDYKYDTVVYIIRRIFIDFNMILCNFFEIVLNVFLFLPNFTYFLQFFY